MTTPDTVSLVFGAGGLLGSGVARYLGPSAMHGSQGYPWSDNEALGTRARSAVERLFEEASRAGRPWTIYWCAGLGHVGASSAVLEADEMSLRTVLAAITSTPPETDGAICLASSAGALYAGSMANPATEDTEVSPLSEYGRSKLRQEAMVAEAVAGSDRMRALVARISNLYGPGQSATKPQGLITTIVRNTLDRRPTNIYVPLDTARDYVHTRSAAQMLGLLTRSALSAPSRSTTIRIVAAERTTSISQIIGTIGRVLRKRVPFVVAERPETRLQPVLLGFRSMNPATHLLDKVTLEEGLASLINHLRQAQASGR
ncbi:MAG: NAD(P)-dependent oxidoreductase [Acidimicrobiia bacterium]|nr:NAD(P)-dependent oxidoreductase [Acidimicrobiia bacterium]